MRKSTLLWLLLAMFCGIFLFHTSQRVHDGREKAAELDQSIAREEESIRVLQAEWGYLNQPDRLEKLARAHLHLEPLKGGQFVKLEEVALRGQKVKGETLPSAAAQTEISKYPHPNLLPEGEGTVKRLTPPLPLGEGGNEATSARKTVVVKKPRADTTASTPRKFNDVMKSLGID